MTRTHVDLIDEALLSAKRPSSRGLTPPCPKPPEIGEGEPVDPTASPRRPTRLAARRPQARADRHRVAAALYAIGCRAAHRSRACGVRPGERAAQAANRPRPHRRDPIGGASARSSSLRSSSSSGCSVLFAAGRHGAGRARVLARPAGVGPVAPTSCRSSPWASCCCSAVSSSDPGALDRDPRRGRRGGRVAVDGADVRVRRSRAHRGHRDVLVASFVQLYVPFLTSVAMILLAQPRGEWWVHAFLILAVAAHTGAYVSGLTFDGVGGIRWPLASARRRRGRVSRVHASPPGRRALLAAFICRCRGGRAHLRGGRARDGHRRRPRRVDAQARPGYQGHELVAPGPRGVLDASTRSCRRRRPPW